MAPKPYRSLGEYGTAGWRWHPFICRMGHRSEI